MLYFYSLLVAVYIFAVGALLAVYQGISRLLHPQPSLHLGWNYSVLALAAAFELFSWRISYRELLLSKDPDETIWQEIIGSKDPTIFTVFLEDSAGLIGAVLAFLGIFLGQVLHSRYFDPAASILIGLLLAAVALLLGRESGALLVGDLLCTWHPLLGRRGPQILPAAFNVSSAQVLESLTRIETISANVTLPGHGEPWTDAPAEAARRARETGPS